MVPPIELWSVQLPPKPGNPAAVDTTQLETALRRHVERVALADLIARRMPPAEARREAARIASLSFDLFFVNSKVPEVWRKSCRSHSETATAFGVPGNLSFIDSQQHVERLLYNCTGPQMCQQFCARAQGWSQEEPQMWLNADKLGDRLAATSERAGHWCPRLKLGQFSANQVALVSIRRSGEPLPVVLLSLLASSLCCPALRINKLAYQPQMLLISCHNGH